MALASRTLANIGSSVGLPQHEVSAQGLEGTFHHLKAAQQSSIALGVSQTPGAVAPHRMKPLCFAAAGHTLGRCSSHAA